MRLLHTSDWHLGRALYDKKRYEEFEAFLSWLEATVDRYQVDALLVAGDVFDNGTPSNRAQELYYRFLCRMAASACRHVVIIAGNHDSPSFLNAPKALLQALDVHVIGQMAGDDEVLVLTGQQCEPELIVCAVPYLRDKDIRTAEAGETIADKERKLLEGIRNHYADIAASAEQKRNALDAWVPVVAMGHLFAAGGKTVDGDGVRELYVGSLAHVNASIFPETLDYVALGHLHVPQTVGGSERIRYSGSPLAIGFGEAGQQKSVCLVEFGSGRQAKIESVGVPVFRELKRVSGDLPVIESKIQSLRAAGSDAWLEVVYEGGDLAGNLREQLDEMLAGSNLEVLRVKNNRIAERVLNRIHDDETLADLDVNEVFARCLAANDVPCDQQPELLAAYAEILASIHEQDSQAE